MCVDFAEQVGALIGITGHHRGQSNERRIIVVALEEIEGNHDTVVAYADGAARRRLELEVLTLENLHHPFVQLGCRGQDHPCHDVVRMALEHDVERFLGVEGERPRGILIDAVVDDVQHVGVDLDRCSTCGGCRSVCTHQVQPRTRPVAGDMQLAVVDAHKEVIGGLAFVVLLIRDVGFERWVGTGEDGVQQLLATKLCRSTTTTHCGSLNVGHRHAAARQGLRAQRRCRADQPVGDAECHVASGSSGTTGIGHDGEWQLVGTAELGGIARDHDGEFLRGNQPLAASAVAKHGDAGNVDAIRAEHHE